MNAAHIAKMLNGHVAGRANVLAPGPGHAAADRSLSVIVDPTAPEGFWVHSFADDPWQVCRDHVRARLGLVDRMPCAPVSRAPAARRETGWNALWNEAEPTGGTLAERYLGCRNISYSGDALRWHPRCPFGEDRLPCMVALVRNIITNEPQAIHRTALRPASDPDFHKALDRKALGPLKGGAVKLTDDADVTLALGIGEGIESTLSIQRLPDLETLPVWSCINKGGLAALPVLPGLKSLWIAVDNDQNGAGPSAAKTVAAAHSAAGVETILFASRTIGDDLNDEVKRHA